MATCLKCGLQFLPRRPSAVAKFCSRRCAWDARLQPSGTLASRLWARVRKMDNGCWEWTGRLARGGYGLIRRDNCGPYVGVHRVSWELAHGSINDGLFVCHRCDNPPCVRPEHLFLGTHRDNMRDCFEKGRHPAAWHLLTKEQVADVRRTYRKNVVGFGQRALAKRLGCSPSTIQKIVENKTWRGA